MNSTLATLMVAADAKEQGDLETYNALISELCDVEHQRCSQRRSIDRWDLVYQYEDIEDDEERRQWRIQEIQRLKEIPWLDWLKSWPPPLDIELLKHVDWDSRVHPVTAVDALEEELSRVTFNALVSVDKVPYTADGIEMIRQAMLAQPGVLDVTIQANGHNNLKVNVTLDNAINVVNIQGTIEV